MKSHTVLKYRVAEPKPAFATSIKRALSLEGRIVSIIIDCILPTVYQYPNFVQSTEALRREARRGNADAHASELWFSPISNRGGIEAKAKEQCHIGVMTTISNDGWKP